MDGRGPPEDSELALLFDAILWETAFDNECPVAGELAGYYVRAQRNSAYLQALLGNLPRK
jgi:hypothetical protein